MSQLSIFERLNPCEPPAKARKRQCGRDPETGPGSCWHWWDSCPKNIRDCYARAKLALIATHFGPAEFHPDQRAKSPAAAPFVEALARLHARRLGQRTQEPACVGCGVDDTAPGDWRWSSFEPRLCSNCKSKDAPR